MQPAELGRKCTSCGAMVASVNEMIYAASGDLICLDCSGRAERAAAAVRRSADRDWRIIGAAATFAGLAAFAAYAYVFHDKRSHYVENGFVQDSSDASWGVLKLGIFFALFA